VTLALAAIPVLLVVAASWSYLRDVARPAGDPRRADPRLASWTVWAFSMGVAAAGAGVSGQWPGMLLAAAGSATAVTILAAGWRHGDREAGRLDAAGLAAGLAGVALLAAGLPGWAAVAVSVLADLAAFLPTFVNGWRDGEEPAVPWAVITAAAAVTLVLAGPAVAAAGLIFPAYELAACALMTVLAVAGRARRGSTAPAAGQ